MSRGPKTNGYQNLGMRRLARQERVAERLELRAERTDAQQVENLKARPGESRRERERLEGAV